MNTFPRLPCSQAALSNGLDKVRVQAGVAFSLQNSLSHSLDETCIQCDVQSMQRPLQLSNLVGGVRDIENDISNKHFHRHSFSLAV